MEYRCDHAVTCKCYLETIRMISTIIVTSAIHAYALHINYNENLVNKLFNLQGHVEMK